VVAWAAVIMDEAEKARTEAMFAKDDLAKAKFEAQLRAHRAKTVRRPFGLAPFIIRHV
jgi:hypothetical protein